jgi:hypothetical protein
MFLRDNVKLEGYFFKFCTVIRHLTFLCLESLLQNSFFFFFLLNLRKFNFVICKIY